MNFFKDMRNIIVIYILILAIGCAGMSTVISKASGALPIIESVYELVLAKKMNPLFTIAATIILQQMDAIAAAIKAGNETPEMKAKAEILKAQAIKLGV